MNALTPLERVHTNPASLARTRERVGLITEAARRAGSYVAGASHRPVAPTADAVAGLGAFRLPLPESPRPAREVLAELDAFGSPATTVVTHGRHFGFVTGGTDPAAGAAAILAGAWDQNPGGASPVAETLDAVACSWIVEALGLPSGAVASFNGGATIANLTGIIAARDALLARAGWDVARSGLAGAPRLRVIVGDEVHVSALKALRLAGIGEAQIERVPTDGVGAIDASTFPSDTDHLTLVLLQAGNVNTGASDPFATLIPGVRERGGWVHVDGAFGLWAAAAPSLRDQVTGVELADSWATDGHKWLNLPYDSGIVIMRDGDALGRAMTSDAPYLPPDPAAPRNRGIQISQRARGIEAWAMLASHGRSGVAELIERSCALALRLADTLADGGAEILAPVMLNQVLVAFSEDADLGGAAGGHGAGGNGAGGHDAGGHDGGGCGACATDAATDAVIAAVQAEGTTWASPTVWHGRRAMRLSVSDAATTTDDVDAAAAAILDCWERTRL